MEWIWIFHGNNGRFASAAFVSKNDAEAWVKHNNVSGMLTKMPIGMSVYDRVIKNDYWHPKKDREKTGVFIEGFTSAYLEHSHYKNGKNCEDD